MPPATMRRWSLVGLLTLAAGLPGQAHSNSMGPSCEAAAQLAESETGLPPGLLNAIGQVEAGRRLALSGGARIWPWTVNARGRGSFLADATEAVSYVSSLLSQGIQSIDVGCFQVNLAFHPDAFASVSEAFDPLANARYAARFLTALRRETGDWGGAIARYHSATQELGIPYRTLVFAAWSGVDPNSTFPPYSNSAYSSPVSASLGRISKPGADDPVVVRMSPQARSIHVYYGAIAMPRTVP